MNIVDLIPQYRECYVQKRNLSEYEHSCPALFEHYFTYWGDRGSFRGALTGEEARERAVLIKKHCPVIEKQFSDCGFDISDLEIILFVGQGYTNGHAFEDGGEFKVFLPVEGYETDRQVFAFVPHEIIHAIHYQKQPDFYFKNKEEKEKFSRLLITEGLATLLTKKIMELNEGEALWADHMNDTNLKKWMQECKEQLPKLYEFAVQNFDKSDNSLMFYTADKNDIFKYRAGYYAGMQVLKEAAERQNISNKELLTAQRRELETMVLETMKEYI